jgi:hypothetical protein
VLPRRLAERCGQALWRTTFALPLADAASRQEYKMRRAKLGVHLPGRELTARIAFTACNGSEEGDTWADSKQRKPLWVDLARKHRSAPFSLLVQGGDQLYADPIWRDVPALAEWRGNRGGSDAIPLSPLPCANWFGTSISGNIAMSGRKPNSPACWPRFPPS